ncbi:hypothetical protein V6N13_055024 [Hibiscus sabdariffa]|uniref:Uncharacterized protein n=1 Tax=Hibiscus sabdariffa TaxID=183260 RepID=A0ABR2DW05_9ROSI
MDVQHGQEAVGGSDAVKELLQDPLNKGKSTYATMVTRVSNGLDKSLGSGGEDKDIVGSCRVSLPSPMLAPSSVDLVERVAAPGEKGSELFRSWMVAEPRRRRLASTSRPGTSRTATKSTVEGSRFAILSYNKGSNVSPVANISPSRNLQPAVEVNANVVAHIPNGSSHCTGSRKNAAYNESNPRKKKKTAKPSIESVNVVPLASDQSPAQVAFTSVSNADNHTVVSIIERYDESLQSVGGKIVKPRSRTSRVSSEGGKRGFPIRKPAELRSPHKSTMAEWALNLSHQLQVAGHLGELGAVEPDKEVVDSITDPRAVGGGGTSTVISPIPNVLEKGDGCMVDSQLQ